MSNNYTLASDEEKQPRVVNSVPTNDFDGAKVPDWAKINFENMSGVIEDGELVIPRGIVKELGYDPSRIWRAGQKPDEFLKLGDFGDSFQLQNFSLDEIAEITGLDLEQLNLNDFGVMELQDIGSLIEAIPSLKNLSLKDVKPIWDLVKDKVPINPQTTVNQLLSEFPDLKNLDFQSLGIDKYGIDSIPGLGEAPIAAFKNWEGINISNIPSLNQIPFDQFPNPIDMMAGMIPVAQADIMFGTDEEKRHNTISGSYKENLFKTAKCNKNCAHMELSGLPPIKGKAWISGKYQIVEGGEGALGAGGMEPTGIHPFGPAFKVALWNVSEVDGMANLALFFRFCVKAPVYLGCTPYIIGPFPFMLVREKDFVFLGLSNAGFGTSTSTPTGLTSSGFSFKKPLSSLTKKSYLPKPSKLISSAKFNQDICRDLQSADTNIEALREAIFKVEKAYNFAGNKNKEKISSKSMKDLKKLAESQIDNTTGENFTGERLIQRIAQMHFGGSAIPIDSDIAD
ncbi:MAG: hypothetical protein AAF378_05585, partial [Cyanobacteria bacterium P01_A01_bin.84]